MRHEGMKMSSGLRKTPTVWLDSRDSKIDVGNEVGESSSSPENTSKSDLEVIMGNLSRDTSPERCERRSRRPAIRYQELLTNCAQSPKQYHRNREKSSNVATTTERVVDLASSDLSPMNVTFAEIGAARGIGGCGLLSLRLVFLSVLGISAGVAFSVRNSVPLASLLTEVFVWLHVLHLFLIPFLLLTSLMVLSLPVRESDNTGRPVTGSVWAVVNSAAHVLHIFSQVELIRLLVLHSFPSLQPYRQTSGTNAVFSLRSVFAAQRYMMAVFSVTELFFSKSPHYFFHTFVVLILSLCWEVCMCILRDVGKTVGVRIGLLIGSVALAVGLSALNVFLRRLFPSAAPALSPSRDDLGKVMQIV